MLVVIVVEDSRGSSAEHPSRDREWNNGRSRSSGRYRDNDSIDERLSGRDDKVGSLRYQLPIPSVQIYEPAYV